MPTVEPIQACAPPLLAWSKIAKSSDLRHACFAFIVVLVGATAVSSRSSWGLLMSIVVYIVAWSGVLATSSLSSKSPPRMLGSLAARLSISRSSRPMPQLTPRHAVLLGFLQHLFSPSMYLLVSLVALVSSSASVVHWFMLSRLRPVVIARSCGKLTACRVPHALLFDRYQCPPSLGCCSWMDWTSLQRSLQNHPLPAPLSNFGLIASARNNHRSVGIQLRRFFGMQIT